MSMPLQQQQQLKAQVVNAGGQIHKPLLVYVSASITTEQRQTIERNLGGILFRSHHENEYHVAVGRINVAQLDALMQMDGVERISIHTKIRPVSVDRGMRR